MSEHKRILMFIGHYLPGTKSGGILRSVENMVSILGNQYKFKIITRDRDINSNDPYTNIDSKKWNKVGNAEVFYLQQEHSKFNNLINVINNESYDILYINSIFDKLSLKIIIAHKLKKLPKKHIIISPRGEFAWASFKLRLFRKLIYVSLSRLLGLYSGLVWHVSSRHESNDLKKIMNIRDKNIQIAMDLPKIIPDRDYKNESSYFSDNNLKIIFLSRISEEKNLDIALKIISEIKSNIIFEIYGPIDSNIYWKKCKKIIHNLPKNILVNYNGFVEPGEVLDIFSKHDLFLFPTGGENFGHVIAESISVGTKVLLSKNTPWLDLEINNLGWNFEINEIEKFRDIIDQVSKKSVNERISERSKARNSFLIKFKKSQSLNENIRLFS
ncbi:glycosyltransferase [Gammaproteobacteria bacterium]|nr:glycosyltransferase [Gammaproteobacteria bacterium]